jgi:hypothetical protein
MALSKITNDGVTGLSIDSSGRMLRGDGTDFSGYLVG